MKKRLPVKLLLLCVFSITTADTIVGEAYGRCKCMTERQIQGCSGNFLETYPNLSRSAGDLRVPDSCFFLYTNKDPLNAEFLHECGGRLPENTNFQTGKPTVIIIHGFTQDACLQVWMRDMKNEFLKKGDYNVIIIDYSWNNVLDTNFVARNSKLAGDQIAVMIDNIKSQTGATEDDFYLIGMSQGAHVAGFIGNVTKVRRITALEPAGPFYLGKPVTERLDRNDAKLVDIIHTGGGKCAPFFGDINPTGDADFYVNGGSVQPRCYETGLEYLIRGDFVTGIQYLALSTACYHLQSIKYYIATINPEGCELIGTECTSYKDYNDGRCGICPKEGNDCAVMGLDWDKSPPKKDDEIRKYYLNITTPCPYCIADKPIIPGL